jgi:hypothetical protein
MPIAYTFIGDLNATVLAEQATAFVLNGWRSVNSSSIHSAPETRCSPRLPASFIRHFGVTSAIPPVRVVYVGVNKVDVITVVQHEAQSAITTAIAKITKQQI